VDWLKGAAMPQRRSVRLEWEGYGLRFRGGGTEPETPSIPLDGDGATGPSPMLALLLALAACSGSDVVVMLQKMRVDLRSAVLEIEGTRRDEEPRRYVAITLRYRLAADGLDRARAQRAVSLSLEKYCSVAHSLARDIELSYEIELG
jgi:putative redox protein